MRLSDAPASAHYAAAIRGEFCLYAARLFCPAGGVPSEANRLTGPSEPTDGSGLGGQLVGTCVRDWLTVAHSRERKGGGSEVR